MENPSTIALSRLVAQQRALDVTATNLANAGTLGFRAERTLFSDWMVRQTAKGEPPGGQTVSYAQDRATYRDGQAGTLRHTANPLDLAMAGPTGWFTVQSAAGPRLTRAGHFQLGSGGAIVDEDGNALLDVNGRPLQTAPTDTQLSVAGDGTVSSENGQIGRVGVVQPADESAMRAEGGRLYSNTSPTSPVAAPRLVQGAVEDSNVQPIAELNRMTNDLREFQFTTQIIQGENDRQNGAIDKILKKGT
jgi:flagellar basal-body rod protein FlgF